MKNLFLLLFVLPFVFASCSSDDEGESGTNNNEKISDIKTSKAIIGVGQKITLTAESNLKSTILDWYDNSEKFPSYGVKNEVEWQPKKSGEHNIKVIGKNELNQDVSFEKKISVVKCDFGFAIWGDNRDIILKSESGALVSAENTMNLEYVINGTKRRNYTFKGGNSLSQGVETITYIITETSTEKLNIASLRYMAVISSLESVYGKYVSSGMGRYDTTVDTGRKQMGSVIFNGVPIETKFENNRTSVNCYTKSDNSASIKIVIEYSKK